MNKIVFSKKSDKWNTPIDFYNKLNNLYSFDLDPCSDNNNLKTKNFYTEKENGLIQKWKGNVFCNPPYSNIKQWVKKCSEEKYNCNIIVLLIPARTDTKYFHEYIYNQCDIEFIKGRLKFGNSKNSAPFPSMLVFFK